MRFDPFDSNDILLDNMSDPDFNLFNQNFENLDTPYFLPEDLKNNLNSAKANSFSILHSKN